MTWRRCLLAGGWLRVGCPMVVLSLRGEGQKARVVSGFAEAEHREGDARLHMAAGGQVSMHACQRRNCGAHVCFAWQG